MCLAYYEHSKGHKNRLFSVNYQLLLSCFFGNPIHIHMPFDNKFLTSVLLIALLAACSDQEASREPSEVGQVDITEVLRLGDEAAGDTVLFSRITHLAVNSRGDIIVEEARRASIRAFNSEGAYVNNIGAMGEGPGEYRYTWGVAVGPADSVYLWEVYTDRVMVYDPHDFSFVRHVTVEDEGIKGAMGIIGIVEAGWIIPMRASSFQPTDDGKMTVHEDNDFQIRKVDLDGSYGQEIIATVRENEMIPHVYEDANGFTIYNVPYARNPAWAMGPNDMLYYGWGDAIQVTVANINGSIQARIHYEHDPVFITDAEIEATAQDMVSEQHEKLLAERGPHETKPAFETFVVDEAGNVWVKLSSIENATTADWLILDIESEVVGIAVLPINVTLKMIRNGRAYGTEQQDGEDIMVVVYEIE